MSEFYACWCVLAGTDACKHCGNNPNATDVWSNAITTDRIELKPFGNGLDVCPVCGKPSSIGKPKTNADKIRSMTDEELAEFHAPTESGCPPGSVTGKGAAPCPDSCYQCWLDWLRQEVSDA